MIPGLMAMAMAMVMVMAMAMAMVMVMVLAQRVTIDSNLRNQLEQMMTRMLSMFFLGGV